MGENTERRRFEGLTQFVGVEEVMTLLRCKKETAAGLLRVAAGRLPGERGMLRVPKPVWEQFILRHFRQTVSTRTRIEPRPLDTRQKDGAWPVTSSDPVGPRRPKDGVYVSSLIPEVKAKKRS